MISPMKQNVGWLGVFAVVLTGGVRGDDARGHGRSVHGEAFDEGPRQSAVLLGEASTGKVVFPVTATNDGARAFFTQGVAQLHAFLFFEAERSFRQALKLDPGCSMAFWGMAVANRSQPKRARELMEKAVAGKDKVGVKERRWMEAYKAYFAEKPDETARRKGLVKALEGLVLDFPDDVEARAWLVLELWNNSFHGIPLTSHVAVDSLISSVLRDAPMHPGAHHYRIHLWNYEDDKRALGSAALCGQSGPGIAHLWHMPGHTYTRLSRFADAAWQQEASARVDHAWMRGRRLMPDQIHNYAHNNDWLVETLGFLGRVDEAIALAKNMIELPRLGPRTAVVGRKGDRDSESSNRMGTRRLMELLLTFELWEELEVLKDGPYLAVQEHFPSEAARQRLLAAWSLGRGDRVGAEAALKAVDEVIAAAVRKRFEAADTAERKALEAGKGGADGSKAAMEALNAEKGAVEDCRAYRAEVELMLAADRGDGDRVKFLMKDAKKLTGARKARFQFGAGEVEEGLKLARETAEKDHSRVFSEAVYAELLWKKGDVEGAKGAFEKLRKTAAEAKLGLRMFGRLEPLVKASGVDGDWRQARVLVGDTGVRPRLDSLGPFRWEPVTAPAWSLEDERGAVHSSKDYAGSPVLLIFYLGSGCMHCIEQLNTFGPFADRFRELGFPIVAVSTDSREKLGKTLEKAKEQGSFPFPVVADPDLTTFKAFGAYDDFEEQPLHGTFLIDGRGRVMWQDISYEPFDKAEWLLGEARRLKAFRR
jgi:peroxiredoxin/tetratricopeptide (TPR) repeat protein